MLHRQLLHCLQHPLLHTVWRGAAATAPAWTAAATQLSGATSATTQAQLQFSSNVWRGFAADALTGLPAGDKVPLSGAPGAQQGAPQPAVLRPQVFEHSFRSPPVSLQFNRGDVVYLPQLEGNVLGRGLLYLIGAYSHKQQLRNGASVLYAAITEAAEQQELQQALGLEVGSFMAPYHLLSLHMWLIINRMDQEPDSKDNKFLLHTLYHDYFYKDIERRVVAHGVQIRVGKWVDKLQKQFYGASFAYDKAIRAEGGSQAQHAALVDALVRNMYHADNNNKPWAQLMARYLIRELQCLGQTDAAAIYKGHIRFSPDVVRR